jgi:hypothetical protein
MGWDLLVPGPDGLVERSHGAGHGTRVAIPSFVTKVRSRPLGCPTDAPRGPPEWRVWFRPLDASAHPVRRQEILARCLVLGAIHFP